MLATAASGSALFPSPPNQVDFREKARVDMKIQVPGPSFFTRLPGSASSEACQARGRDKFDAILCKVGGDKSTATLLLFPVWCHASDGRLHVACIRARARKDLVSAQNLPLVQGASQPPL